MVAQLCRTVILCALMAALVGLVGVTPAAVAAEPGRLAGETRYDTAVRIGQEAFDGTADAVYLARADHFADALAAGALTDGPILLVPPSGQVPDVVIDEVARLEPEEIVVLGGEAAIDQDVVDQVAGHGPTVRLAGTDRYATAVKISQQAYGDGADVAYLARADAFPDALAAGALTDGPILLVPPSGQVPDVVADEIRRLDPNDVIALGGTAAISDGTLADAGQGRQIGRLAGPDRYATAVRIAQHAFGGTPNTIYVARGDDFPDALAAGALTDGPVLLIQQCGNVPSPAANYISAADPDRVIALGGKGAICDQALDAAAAGIVCDPNRADCDHLTSTVHPADVTAEQLLEFLATRVGEAVTLDVEIVTGNDPSADGWLGVPGSYGISDGDCADTPEGCGAEYRSMRWRQTDRGWRLAGTFGVLSLAGPQQGWYSIVLGDPDDLPPTMGLQATGPVAYGMTPQQARAASDGRFTWEYVFTEAEDGFNCGEGRLEGVDDISFLVGDVVEYAAVWWAGSDHVPPVRTEGGGQIGMTFDELEQVAQRLDATITVEQHEYDRDGQYIFMHPRAAHLADVGYRFDLTDPHGSGQRIVTAILAGSRGSIRLVEGCV